MVGLKAIDESEPGNPDAEEDDAENLARYGYVYG
jgi:hypothetical protein